MTKRASGAVSAAQESEKKSVGHHVRSLQASATCWINMVTARGPIESGCRACGNLRLSR